MRNLLLISSSAKSKGEAMLTHARAQIIDLLQDRKELLFIPYSRPDGIRFEAYTEKIREAFASLELPYKVLGIESFANPRTAIETAEAVFVGGGNTFLLLRTLYKHEMMQTLRNRAEQGMPYMGSSAGSNIAGLTINTTNDMPIVMPPSMNALGLVPFNINPHYPRQHDTLHNGETRDQRIHEFHHVVENDQAVLALREDSMLRIQGDKINLVSADNSTARLFRQGQDLVELPAGDLGLA